MVFVAKSPRPAPAMEDTRTSQLSKSPEELSSFSGAKRVGSSGVEGVEGGEFDTDVDSGSIGAKRVGSSGVEGVEEGVSGTDVGFWFSSGKYGYVIRFLYVQVSCVVVRVTHI